MDEAVLYEHVGDHVVLVTLNRPEKRNAVNSAVAQRLDAAVRRADADPAVRAVVLFASGDKAFCAGADLAEVAAGNATGTTTPEGGFGGFVWQKRAKPWIAAVRGVAIGGGAEIAFACDMIVAGQSARFSLPEVKRCLVAGAGGIQRLSRVMPQAIALELLLTGDPIDAARAATCGLVNNVVPDDKVREEAIALAQRVAMNAPLAVQHTLRLARTAYLTSDGDGRTQGEAAIQSLRATEDFKEATRAFMEKRAAVWTGC